MLHYTVIQGSTALVPLICLHGLYGYGRNWLGVARQWGRVYLPDLRNHGKSFHHAQHDYASMAKDLEELVQTLELEHFALLGHSMGGKVAMHYALEFGQKLSHLIVADIAPKAYLGDEHEKILQALMALDLTQIKSRQEADEALKEQLPQAQVRQFLLSNLRPNPQGQWQWQINLQALRQNLPEIRGNSLPDKVCQGPRVLFLSGALSNYVQREDQPVIKKYFPQARFVKLKDAGHWLHIDQPEAVAHSVRSFLKSAAPHAARY